MLDPNDKADLGPLPSIDPAVTTRHWPLWREWKNPLGPDITILNQNHRLGLLRNINQVNVLVDSDTTRRDIY